MANTYPSIPSFGYPHEWAYDGWQGFVLVDNNDEVTMSDGKEYNANKVDRAFQWASTGQIGNDDEVILYENDAFMFEPNPKTIVKFRVRVVGENATAAYNYVVNVKKGSQSVPTGLRQSSTVSCLSNYKTGSNYVDFDVTLNGSDSNFFQ